MDFVALLDFFSLSCPKKIQISAKKKKKKPKKPKKPAILKSEPTFVNISASCWGEEELDDVFYVGKDVGNSAVWS